MQGADRGTGINGARAAMLRVSFLPSPASLATLPFREGGRPSGGWAAAGAARTYRAPLSMVRLAPPKGVRPIPLAAAPAVDVSFQLCDRRPNRLRRRQLLRPQIVHERSQPLQRHYRRPRQLGVFQ